MKKIQIFKNQNSAIIYFNSKFYSKNSLLNSIKEFKHLINSKLLKLGNFYIVEIRNKTEKYEIEKVIKEFFNYILFIEFQNQNQKDNKIETKLLNEIDKK